MKGVQWEGSLAQTLVARLQRGFAALQELEVRNAMEVGETREL